MSAFVGTLQGGVYASEDFTELNETWQAINAGLPTLDLRELQVDQDCETLYCLTNTTENVYRQIYPGSWTLILSQAAVRVALLQPTARIVSISVDPLVTGALYVLVGWIGVGGGVYMYKSYDYGNTFVVETVFFDGITTVQDILNIGAYGGVIGVTFTKLAGAKHFLRRSTDGGAIWTESVDFGFGVAIVSPVIIPLFGTDTYSRGHVPSDFFLRDLVRIDALGAGITLQDGLDILPDRRQAMWFSQMLPGNHLLLNNARLFETVDSWANVVNPAPVAIVPSVQEIIHYALNEQEFIMGKAAGVNAGTPNHIYTYDRATATLTAKSGPQSGAAPFADSIPWTAGGICFNGIQFCVRTLAEFSRGVGAMAGRVLQSNEGHTVYARPSWGFDPFEWLGECSRLDSISAEQGDLSPQHCIDPRTGRTYVRGTTRANPGLVTSSMISKARLRNFMIDNIRACAHDFDMHIACKNLDDPEGWEEIVRLCRGVIVTPELSGFDPTADGKDRLATDPITALAWHKIYRVNVEIYEPSEAVSWIDVDTCHGDICGGLFCGPFEGERFAAVSTLESGLSPYLKVVDFDRAQNRTITTYQLTEWTTDGANAVLCLGDYIFIVSDGEALPILRSKDGGATRVALAGNADMAGNPPTCIDGVNLAQLIIGGQNGYIYISYDQGSTWQTASAGVATVENINKVMISRDDPSVVYAVGANNALIKSEDGGRHWFALTGPSPTDNLTALDVYSPYDVRVGNDDGELWETDDGGETWAQSTQPVVTAGAVIRDITHCGCRVSYMALADTTVVSFAADTEQRLYRNVKEGTHWETPNGGELAVPSAGLEPYAVACSDSGNLALLVGGNNTDDGFWAFAEK